MKGRLGTVAGAALVLAASSGCAPRTTTVRRTSSSSAVTRPPRRNRSDGHETYGNHRRRRDYGCVGAGTAGVERDQVQLAIFARRLVGPLFDDQRQRREQNVDRDSKHVAYTRVEARVIDGVRTREDDVGG